MLGTRTAFRAAWILAAAVSAGCGGGPTSTFEELGQDGNTRGFGRLYPQDPNENAFTFGVGDSMEVRVHDSPEFSTIDTVRQDGRITIPLVGDVAVGGLTTDQVARKVATLISPFKTNPRVSVTVLEVQSKVYYIAGQNPSTGGTEIKRLPYRGDTTLLDAFVEMGSPSTLLDDDTRVRVIMPDPRHPVVHTINVREIFLEGRSGGNIQIRPDTIVHVPPTTWGQISHVIAGVSVPLESLFRISRSVVELDSSVRVLQGEDIYRRRR